MQNISELLKEAKPLYLKRKRRNTIIKSTAVFACCAFLMVAVWPEKQVADFSYWDLGYSDTETASYVENFGLPVDDYGLLLVG